MEKCSGCLRRPAQQDSAGVSEDADVMVVESPVILNEVMQNSLMVSRVLKHPLWIKTVDSIVEITSFINARDRCYAKKWGGCKIKLIQ